jgi:integrase
MRAKFAQRVSAASEPEPWDPEENELWQIRRYYFSPQLTMSHPKIFNRLCARAGLENVKVHTLRHTFAATAAELGFSELTIAGLYQLLQS